LFNFSHQPLSEAQLRQISSILRSQKATSGVLSGTDDGKNEVLDPKTNTRIVYRVVYPDEDDEKAPSEEIKPKSNSLTRNINKLQHKLVSNKLVKLNSMSLGKRGRTKGSTKEALLEKEREAAIVPEKVQKTDAKTKVKLNFQ